MRVIGLTGGIACGKSTVSDWLSSRPDCRIIDGDLLSRELTAPGGAALDPLRNCFGDEVFCTDGSLNRRRLGKLVFSDPEARGRLDDLMAPLLRKLTLSRISQAREEGVDLCFLDFPLLFEKGYDSLCDTVWCITLPRSVQLKRLMARDHLSEEEALQRMNAVLSTEEKAARSQVLIDNSGEITFTLSLLPSLVEAEKAKAAPPRRRRSDLSSPQAGSGNDHLPQAGPLPPVPDEAVMERPASFRNKSTPKKVAWRLPVWLVWLLSSAGFLVLACFTAQSLMQAYLTRQAERHQSEARAIFANYPLEYGGIIAEQSAEFNLNPAFVAAIIRNESSFQPMAESTVGARGLMQLMPETAEWIAGKMKLSGYAFDRMYDPESNIRFGCWYLQYLASLFHGDPVCVACGYHAGQGQVTAWLSDPRYSQDGIRLSLSDLTEGPTKTYAGRVIRTYGIYQALYYTSDHHDADVGSALSRSDGLER